MKRIGVIDVEPRWRKRFDPVDALARAILQQLSGRAAAIVGRVEAVIGSACLHTQTPGRVDELALRACEVSVNKILVLRDLRGHEQRGEIPMLRQMATMHHKDIVAAPVPIRGIGRWTVEMMLMFRLGRPDVLPIDDLGIKKGAQRIDKLESMPSTRQLAVRGERWGRSTPVPACIHGASPMLTATPLRDQPLAGRGRGTLSASPALKS